MTEVAPKSVLVVDDEPIICQTLKMILRFDGHRAEAVMTGQAALDAVASNSFDIVFLDYQMPGMTGDKVARAIRSQSPQKPIIFITGCVPKPSSPDIDLVIEKPFSVTAIRDAMTRAR